MKGFKSLRPTYGLKLYYVFFNLNGKNEGKYARIFAKNYQSARATAYELFGQEVATVEGVIEYAENKIKMFGYTELKARES
jgi:hypothetical protein